MSGVETTPKEPSSVRLAGTLAFFGLLSGLILVFVYQGTLPRIEHNKAERLRKAVFKVVPGAAKMQPLVWQEPKLAPGETGPERIFAAYDSTGAFLGYAIPNQGNGFQDVISLIFGYDPARRRIVGMEILDSRETPGLGDKIYKDPEFVNEFENLAVEPEVKLVKGTGPGENEVDAITGATISSKAVVRIINEANARWLGRLPAPGSEPGMGTPGAPADSERADAVLNRGGER